MTVNLRTNKKSITINLNKMTHTLIEWSAKVIVIGAASWVLLSWACLMFRPLGAEIASWNFFVAFNNFLANL